MIRTLNSPTIWAAWKSILMLWKRMLRWKNSKRKPRKRSNQRRNSKNLRKRWKSVQESCLIRRRRIWRTTSTNLIAKKKVSLQESRRNQKKMTSLMIRPSTTIKEMTTAKMRNKNISKTFMMIRLRSKLMMKMTQLTWTILKPNWKTSSRAKAIEVWAAINWFSHSWVLTIRLVARREVVKTLVILEACRASLLPTKWSAGKKLRPKRYSPLTK